MNRAPTSTVAATDHDPQVTVTVQSAGTMRGNATKWVGTPPSSKGARLCSSSVSGLSVTPKRTRLSA
jgi:hypothetical protein